MKRTGIGATGLLFIAAASLAASAFSAPEDQARRSSPDRPLEVSLIQIIARPSDFDGEYVRVSGFYRHEFEGNALYLHREDYAQGLRKNGLWMNGKADDNMKYILVEGRFNAQSLGHLGLWSGEIEAVTRTLRRAPTN
jgi:hypothetical protein